MTLSSLSQVFPPGHSTLIPLRDLVSISTSRYSLNRSVYEVWICLVYLRSKVEWVNTTISTGKYTVRPVTHEERRCFGIFPFFLLSPSFFFFLLPPLGRQNLLGHHLAHLFPQSDWHLSIPWPLKLWRNSRPLFLYWRQCFFLIQIYIQVCIVIIV